MDMVSINPSQARYIGLPSNLQKNIITRVITATHGREIAQLPQKKIEVACHISFFLD